MKEQRIEKPNYTQFPNYVLDWVLAELNLSETRVYLYVLRRTFGFHRSYERITIDQFVNGKKDTDGKKLDRGAGISRIAVRAALKSLEKAGLVRKVKSAVEYPPEHRKGAGYEAIINEDSINWAYLDVRAAEKHETKVKGGQNFKSGGNF